MQARQFIAKAEVRSCPRCPSFVFCGELPKGVWAQKNFDRPFRSGDWAAID